MINNKLNPVFLAYLCVFIVSLFYRFYDLDKRGYFPGNDAASYASIAKTYRNASDYIVRTKILGQAIGSMNDYLHESGGEFSPAAKFGLIPIGLIGSLVFGNNPNTMLYTSAMFGVITVLFLFYILLSLRINLLYSFLLSLLFAVSPYHIGFSREGLTVTFSAFFLLAGIYSYIRFLELNTLKYLYFCGLSLGLSFLCHYNIAPFIAIFFAYELYYSIKKQRSFRRIFVLSISAFLPLFLMDLFTRAIKLYGTMQGIKMMDKYYPYFNELFRQLIIVKEGGSDIHAGPFYYFSSLYYHEGIIPAILLIIAAIHIIHKGIKTDSGIGYFFIIIFLLPFLYFLWILHSVIDRQMLSFIPLWYLTVGYGLNSYDKYRKIFILLIMIAIISSGIRSLDYFNYRSNFKQAIDYMERNKGIKHISSVLSLSRLYAGRKNVVNHAESPYSEKLTELRKVVYQINPLSLDKIKSFYNDGYNYLLLNIPPSVSNELTEAAIAIQPEYSTDVMICNDRGDGYDPALLRDKKGKYLYRFNVYDLGKVPNKMGQNK
jgi:hypothetical protein